LGFPPRTFFDSFLDSFSNIVNYYTINSIEEIYILQLVTFAQEEIESSIVSNEVTPFDSPRVLISTI
jgi:hypothetical protein